MGHCSETPPPSKSHPWVDEFRSVAWACVEPRLGLVAGKITIMSNVGFKPTTSQLVPASLPSRLRRSVLISNISFSRLKIVFVIWKLYQYLSLLQTKSYQESTRYWANAVSMLVYRLLVINETALLQRILRCDRCLLKPNQLSNKICDLSLFHIRNSDNSSFKWMDNNTLQFCRTRTKMKGYCLIILSKYWCLHLCLIIAN